MLLRLPVLPASGGITPETLACPALQLTLLIRHTHHRLNVITITFAIKEKMARIVKIVPVRLIQIRQVLVRPVIITMVSREDFV